jgi:hypothetical protein
MLNYKQQKRDKIFVLYIAQHGENEIIKFSGKTFTE